MATRVERTRRARVFIAQPCHVCVCVCVCVCQVVRLHVHVINFIVCVCQVVRLAN